MEIFISIILPFIGTTLGAIMVFFINNMNEKLEKILIGFASGIMSAASIYSLMIPSIELSIGKSYKPYIPCIIGLIIGSLFIYIIDKFSYVSKKNMLAFTVTLHNIPEGMAVGVIISGVLLNNVGITMSMAVALSIGIAIQNIPEGLIVSIPYKVTETKTKSFILGTLSGIVEPISAIITIILSKILTPLLPYLLSFAAGAMIYAVVCEMIPEIENNRYKNIAVIALLLGFLLMMILDLNL